MDLILPQDFIYQNIIINISISTHLILLYIGIIQEVLYSIQFWILSEDQWFFGARKQQLQCINEIKILTQLNLMQKVHKICSWVNGFQNHKIWSAVGLTVSLALILKNYFRGGICKINKDLDGKVAVVTGGNTGIGAQTVKQLVKKGCKVFIGARDQIKTRQLVNYLRTHYRRVDVHHYSLDLASKQSIKQFCQYVKLHCEKIDFLVNNAGVMAIPQRQVTNQGFQMQFGVNHLGHFYLTFLLWDHIKKSQKPRITNVSSNAHRRNKATIDFQDLNYFHNYNPFVAYSRSKIANILFTRQLQRKMNQANIQGIATSLHPGVVRTELSRYMTPKLWQKILFYTGVTLFYPILWIVMKSSWEGAQTTLYTLLQDEDKIQKGQYYADCKVRETADSASNMQSAQRLWNISENQLGITFKV